MENIIRMIKVGIKFDKELTPIINAISHRPEFLLKRMNQVKKVIIPTKNMFLRLTQNGLEPQRTTIIPFGLNLLPFQNIKRQEQSDTLHLAYIGTIGEHKGVHVLVEAVQMLIGKAIELDIYGNLNDFPVYAYNLKSQAKNDPRIRFCGTFPNSEIGNVLSKIDALVVPSLWYENSPLVIYSAQAAGCPVIGSNMAGISEVIKHRHNGLLFEAGDAHQLSSAISILVDEKGLLQELSKNARKPLSIEEYTVKLVDIYNELIQGNKPL